MADNHSDRNDDPSDDQEQSSLSSLSEQGQAVLIREFIRILEDEDYNVEYDDENVKLVLRKDRLQYAAEEARAIDSEKKSTNKSEKNIINLIQIVSAGVVIVLSLGYIVSNSLGFSIGSGPFLALVLVTVVIVMSMVYYDTELR